MNASLRLCLAALAILVAGCDSNYCNKDKQVKVCSKKEAGCDTIYFANDSSSLTAREKEKLDYIVQWMKKDEKATLALEGHASKVGTSEYNLALSKKRLASVCKHLESAGIAMSRVSTVAFGSKQLPGGEGNEEHNRVVIAVKYSANK
ncbi:MAG: OmpA family protein [Alphaproteobacteria bacterium]|nr:MAG: OmpA family protein [Alphaproteobacteria bacterium]